MTVELKLETEEKAAFRRMILKMKEQIKELVEEQKKDKALLHMPHYDIPEVKVVTKSGYEFVTSGKDRAGRLMWATECRAAEITKLHIKYNKVRGKPYDMYEYKKEG